MASISRAFAVPGSLDLRKLVVDILRFMKILAHIFPALCLVALAGCQEDEVQTYKVSKEAPKGWPTQNHSRHTPGTQKGEPIGNPAAGAATQAPAPMTSAPNSGQMQALPGMAEQASQFDTPTWTAPKSWEPQPLGSMRKGSWLINKDGQSADVSVLVFPGDVGGDLANVNRWAQQVGAQALTPEELVKTKAQNPVSVDNHAGFLVNLEGPAGKSIAGVILPYHGATWFFKMQGDTELVNEQAVAFRTFMSSVRFPAH